MTRLPKYLIVLTLITAFFGYLFFFSPSASTKLIAQGMTTLEEKYSFVSWNITGGGYLSETHVYFKPEGNNKTVKFIFFKVYNGTLVSNFQIIFQDELELYLKTVGEQFQVRLVALGSNITIHYLIEFMPGLKYWAFLGLMFFGSITIISIPVVKLSRVLERYYH